MTGIVHFDSSLKNSFFDKGKVKSEHDIKELGLFPKTEMRAPNCKKSVKKGVFASSRAGCLVLVGFFLGARWVRI